MIMKYFSFNATKQEEAKEKEEEVKNNGKKCKFNEFHAHECIKPRKTVTFHRCANRLCFMRMKSQMLLCTRTDAPSRPLKTIKAFPLMLDNRIEMIFNRINGSICLISSRLWCKLDKLDPHYIHVAIKSGHSANWLLTAMSARAFGTTARAKVFSHVKRP